MFRDTTPILLKSKNLLLKLFLIALEEFFFFNIYSTYVYFSAVSADVYSESRNSR